VKKEALGILRSEAQNRPFTQLHHQIFMNYWVARISSCPLWTRLSPPTPPATALAAAEAAGMPVRRPRRPAAVSAADAAGAGPELGCAGQLERAAEAPTTTDETESSLWVGLSVDRSVDRSGLVGD
jgi:hypothetical protein